METKKRKRKLNVKLFDYALIGSAIIYLLAELYNKSIPFKYAMVLFLIVIILMAIGLLVNRKGAKVTLAISILIAAAGLFYMQYSIDTLVNFDQFQTNTVSLVVLEDSPYEAIEDLHDNTTLAVSTNFNQNLYEAMLEDLENIYPLNGNVERYDSDISVVDALYDGTIEVMVLDEVFRDTVVESQEDFNNKTRVIYSYEKHNEKNDIAKEVDVRKEGFTIFISGIDVDGPISTVSRSDVNILMTVNPDTNEILLTTTPRDTYVELGCAQGYMKDKLTHAGTMGIECSISTLENLYDIDINYYAKVNFTSLITLIDVLGSVDVSSQYDFYGHDGTHFTQGMNTLNSAQALEFSRTRKTVPGGDITRGLHQLEVIKGIINKLTQPSVLLNINGIVNKVSSSVDTNFGSNNLSRLIEKQLNDGKGWSFNQASLGGVSGGDYTYSYPNQILSVYYPDEASVAEIHQLITNTLQSNNDQ